MLEEIYKNPFTWGLILGLFLMCFVYISGLRKRMDMKAKIKELGGEIDDLKKHLYNQMNITSKGTEEVKNELVKAKTENENLRKTIATLDSKPGRSEMRSLHVYEMAIKTMYEKSPGFATAWQVVMKEAEDKVKESESGFVPLVRRIFSLPGGSAAESAKEKSESSNDEELIGVDKKK